MKKTGIFLTALIISSVLLVAFFAREKKVLIGDFSWSVRGKTAPYSFYLANKTDEKLTVIVVLEAHNATHGRDGVVLRSVGFTKIEIILAGRETKKIEDVLELLDFGSSATKVSYHASLK